eukprot:3902916-Prymnesium_polylepis.1
MARAPSMGRLCTATPASAEILCGDLQLSAFVPSQQIAAALVLFTASRSCFVLLQVWEGKGERSQHARVLASTLRTSRAQSRSPPDRPPDRPPDPSHMSRLSYDCLE